MVFSQVLRYNWHMGKITLFSHAKINLSLDIEGIRPDGYHAVRMVLQSLRLCDQLSFHLSTASAGEGEPGADPAGPFCIRITSDSESIPSDSRNIVHKAASLIFREIYRLIPELPPMRLDVHIRKIIPVAAGLAGGSGNGAAMITALTDPKLWRKTGFCGPRLETALKELDTADLALKTGADVPYCMKGGTMLAEGVGEVLTPLVPGFPEGIPLLLVKPPFGISTAAAYAAYDQLTPDPASRPDTEQLCRAIREKDLPGCLRLMKNVLEITAMESHEEIGQIKKTLYELGALGAMMSGSGPTVFGMFGSAAEARKAWHGRSLFPPGSRILLTATAAGGVTRARLSHR